MNAVNAEKNPVVSAQIVLRSPAGKSMPGVPVTSANIDQFLPRPEVARAVQQALAAFGFEIGPLVGTSFSITAPLNVFERVFNAKLRHERKRGIESVTEAATGGYELPLDALPKTVAENVQAVVFTRPPDFGPTSFQS